MKYEEGKEKGSNLSNQRHMEEDGHEGRRNPTVGEDYQRQCETGNLKSCALGSRRQADQLVINSSEPERSLESFFRNTESLSEFVQKEIEAKEVNGASLSETSSFHSMNMELIRLGSFHNFPASRTISTLKLARQGFYYNGEGDTVVCFACGARKQNWRSEDKIEAVHRSMSPNCPLLASLPTSNVQIGDQQANGHGESSVRNSEKQQSDSTRTEYLASNIPPTLTTTNSSNTSTTRISSDSLSLNETEREPQISNNEANSDTHFSSPKPTPIDHQTRARIQQEKINAFLQGLDPLGINFDRPKYPSYAVVAVRVSSYSHWPSTLTQTPRDLAVAGFFYAGYGDYTRCFFCGGGLRNWEPGDDPWTEHARWFPKCAFIRQNKGDQFVALVQIRHQELEALEASNGHSVDQTNGLGPSTNENFSQIDVTSLPAFQSVQEMGYQTQIIKRAFEHLKRTKEPVNINAEDLLEIILDQEENSGSDIPPSSAAGTADGVTEVKDTTVRSNNDSINAQGKLTESSTKSKATGPKSAVESDTTQSLLEENRQLKDLMMCKICMENEASIAMLPCGHLCCCTDCAPAMRKCPICRQFVKGTVRTWLA